jgi:hypothetical protein
MVQHILKRDVIVPAYFVNVPQERVENNFQAESGGEFRHCSNGF